MVDNITRSCIRDEVIRRGWKYEELPPDGRFYKITDNHGRTSIGIGSKLGSSSSTGSSIARNKFDSYTYVSSLGYRLPGFTIYENDDSAGVFMRRWGKIVVKPTDSEQSRGVTTDVSSLTDLQKAVKEAIQFSQEGKVVLQQQLSGDLYRLLVIGDRLFAASCRRPAFVTGNGLLTIRQLIELKNKHPTRSAGSLSPLKPISIELASRLIGQAGLDRVLGDGENQIVSPIASVSLGGEAEDITERVHSSYSEIAITITRELKLSVCGFDIMTEDITAPCSGVFPLVEFNSMPGFKLHLYPTAGGVSRDPAVALLDWEFPSKD